MANARSTLTEPRPRRPSFVVLLVAVIGLLMSFVVIVTLFGWVSGEEFSPQTFTSRSYQYTRIPFSHIQVWPLREDPFTYSVAQYLTTNKYVPTASSPQRWDLVNTAHPGTSTPRQADASILIDYFRAYDADANAYVWEKWTKDHKKLARPFWSAVARVARENRYYLLPALFDAALAADDPKTFARQLDKLLADEYFHLAQIELEQERVPQAKKLFATVLELEPNRADALRELDRCRNDQP